MTINPNDPDWIMTPIEYAEMINQARLNLCRTNGWNPQAPSIRNMRMLPMRALVNMAWSRYRQLKSAGQSYVSLLDMPHQHDPRMIIALGAAERMWAARENLKQERSAA